MEEMKSRRKFIQDSLGGGLGILFGSVLLLTGCGPGEGEKKGVSRPGSSSDTAVGRETRKEADPCDKTALTQSDLSARKSLGYQDKTPMREKKCKGCKLFVPVSEKRACGGCAILKGPIDPNGYCTYWAAKG